MKNIFSYPFYKSLRFKFGLIFGLLFLICLSGIAFFLYKNVQQQLEKNFTARLKVQAKIILQKTGISPLIIPLPDEQEYFLLTYNNTKKTDTLFNNLPPTVLNESPETRQWRNIQCREKLETGGIVTIVYALPANDLNNALLQLKQVLFIYIPVALVLSFIIAYFLSGFLLKPVTNIISKANNINLQNSIQLIDEPKTKDELHQLVVTLNKMLSRIEKQSQQQNAFFASASHELRTPLSNMLTELQVMQTQSNSPQLQKIFQHQEAEVQRLKKLVNDFLLMSQLKAGAVHVHKTNVDVADACIVCVERLKAKSAIKKQVFKIAFVPENETFTVLVDKDHVHMILFNLLDNAVKYATEGSTLNIIITKEAATVSVKILNATNIDIENVEMLTKEFSRKDVMKEGFGLGLWIAQQLVNINGKALKLSSYEKLFCAELVL